MLKIAAKQKKASFYRKFLETFQHYTTNIHAALKRTEARPQSCLDKQTLPSCLKMTEILKDNSKLVYPTLCISVVLAVLWHKTQTIVILALQIFDLLLFMFGFIIFV